MVTLFRALSAFIVISVFWAYFMRVDIAVRAPGIVRPEGDVIKVVSETGGRIGRVYMNEGDVVRHGSPLLQLDTADLLLKRESLENRIHFTELRLAALLEQIEAAAAIEDETARQEQLEREALDRSAQVSVGHAEAKFNRAVELFREGLIPQQVYEEHRTALAQAQAEQLRLKSQSLEVKRAQALGRLDRMSVEVPALRGELAGLYHQLSQTRLDLQRLTIASPADGQVTSLAPLHAGEYLAAGTAIATLAPASHRLVVESWLPTPDRGFVEAGQLVRLQTGDFTTIDGTILSIGVDSRLSQDVYRVTIAPLDSKDLPMGRSLQVHYVTRRERVLFIPFIRFIRSIRS